jgi:hypothetical protein
LFFRIKVIATNASIVDLLADGSNNAFITDTEYLRFLEKSLNGSVKFTVLKEIVLSDYLGFTFNENNFLLKPVNQIITHLYEAGITKLIIDRETEVKYLETVAERVKLSMDHLGVWFYVYAFMLLIATAAFVLEVFVHKICFKGNLEKRKRKARQTHKTMARQSEGE